MRATPAILYDAKKAIGSARYLTQCAKAANLRCPLSRENWMLTGLTGMKID